MMTMQTTASELPERWLSKREVADHYGFSVRWVEIQIGLGMPARLIGGQRRLRLSQVDEWLRRPSAPGAGELAVAAPDHTPGPDFEIQRMLASIACPAARVAAHAAIRTGERPGGLAGLRWCDLHHGTATQTGDHQKE